MGPPGCASGSGGGLIQYTLSDCLWRLKRDGTTVDCLIVDVAEGNSFPHLNMFRKTQLSENPITHL